MDLDLNVLVVIIFLDLLRKNIRSLEKMTDVLEEFNKKFKTRCCDGKIYYGDGSFLRCSVCHEIKCVGDCCVESKREKDEV